MKCYLIHIFLFRDAHVFASRGPNALFHEGGMSSEHQHFVRKNETVHRLGTVILKEDDDK